MTFYSDTSDVRELAGNILEVDFSDPEIQEEQAAAYDIISTQLGDFDLSHPRIALLKRIEVAFAAALVMQHFPQYRESGYNRFENTLKFLEMIKGSIGDLEAGALDIGFYYSLTEYGSWPAAINEDPYSLTLPYKSTRSNLN